MIIRNPQKTIKARGLNFRYCWDEMCVNYDLKNNCYSIFFNGEIIEGVTSDNFIRDLENIHKQFKDDEMIICFINHLSATHNICPKGIVANSSVKKGINEILTYRTKHFEFRNFNFFCISDAENRNHTVFEMYDFLATLSSFMGKDNICYCKYSVGNVAKKALCFGIEKQIKDEQYKNKNYFDNKEYFQDQYIGCKTGLLKSMKGVYEDCLMVDIKSAYISAFIHLDCFPIGRPNRYEGNEALLLFLKDECHHVIVRTKEPVEDFEMYGKNNEYGFYKFDEFVLRDMGINLKEKIIDLVQSGAEIICYSSTKYGQLLKDVRDRIMEFYDKKKENKNNKLDGKAYKAITQMFYGKALQEHNFKTDQECTIYCKRPENYIRPEYSMIACSFIRYRLSKMIKQFGGCYYNDTDGIEARYSEQNEKMVERENRKVLKRSKVLGYQTDIGTFDIEGKHCTIGIMGHKQRFYLDDNGKLIIKIAGVQKNIFKELDATDDIIFKLLTQEITIPQTLIQFDKESKQFREVCIEIKLPGCAGSS